MQNNWCLYEVNISYIYYKTAIVLYQTSQCRVDSFHITPLSKLVHDQYIFSHSKAILGDGVGLHKNISVILITIHFKSKYNALDIHVSFLKKKNHVYIAVQTYKDL